MYTSIQLLDLLGDLCLCKCVCIYIGNAIRLVVLLAKQNDTTLLERSQTRKGAEAFFGNLCFGVRIVPRGSMYGIFTYIDP